MNMNMNKKPFGYWNNKENIINVAKLYNNISSFFRFERGAYSAMYKLGIVNEIKEIFKVNQLNGVGILHKKEGKRKKPNGFWNDKGNIIKYAIKFGNISDFYDEYSSAAVSVKRNGWEDIMLKIFPNTKHTTWDLEKCQRVANKYDIKNDFFINERGAYSFASRNGLLDVVCSHMKTSINNKKRCIYVYTFSDNSVYVGLTHDLHKRKLNRKRNKNDAVIKHINITKEKPICLQLTKYVDVNIAKELEKKYINKYRDNGYHILNSRGGGELGSNIIKWDYDTCLKISKKYNTKSDFIKNESLCYYASKRNGWIDDFFKTQSKKPGYWKIYENCKNESKKYKNRTEFGKKCSAGWHWSKKYNWLDDFFQKK